MKSEDKLKIRPRCNGCAFTPGTPANLDILTQAKARLCVTAYEPFFCHENAVNDVLPKGREHLCRGWFKAVSGPEYPPEWKRKTAVNLLHVIEKFEADSTESSEAEIQSAIMQAIMEAR